jgi:hypothetical protein
VWLGLDLVEMNPTSVPFTFKNSGLITLGNQHQHTNKLLDEQSTEQSTVSKNNLPLGKVKIKTCRRVFV